MLNCETFGQAVWSAYVCGASCVGHLGGALRGGGRGEVKLLLFNSAQGLFQQVRGLDAGLLEDVRHRPEPAVLAVDGASQVFEEDGAFEMIAAGRRKITVVQLENHRLVQLHSKLNVLQLATFVKREVFNKCI